MMQGTMVKWLGYAMSAVVVAALLADAGVQLFSPATLQAEMTASGFPMSLSTPLGLIMLACAVLYAFPRTAVLGAILISAFCGGAICTHFRLGDFAAPPQVICLLLAVFAWGGLYLRDLRVRELLPLTLSP